MSEVTIELYIVTGTLPGAVNLKPNIWGNHQSFRENNTRGQCRAIKKYERFKQNIDENSLQKGAGMLIKLTFIVAKAKARRLSLKLFAADKIDVDKKRF